MKLWEAMKLLDEDPTKKFEYQNDRKRWLLYTEVGRLTGLVFYMLDCWDSNGELMTGTVFGGLHDNLTTSDNWQLVKQSVPWQEAIEAWVDGKTISYSYKGYDRRYGFKDSDTMLLSIEKIEDGKWYIENEREK